VHDFALGLIELGLGRGDVVGIIGDNRPDWVSGEIATHAIGAMSLGLYRDVLDEEAAYLLSYGEAKLVFAEDEEQVDKLLTLADRVPNLRHIIYSDPRGMRKYDDPRLMAADKLASMGRDRAACEPDLYDKLVDATKGEDVAILCTTSGNHGQSEIGDARRGEKCCGIARLICRSTRRGRMTNTSRCCRCRGSWNRSTRSVRACCAG